MVRTALWTATSPMNAEAAVEVDGHKVLVTGTLNVGADGVQPKALCADPKARVRMEMWVKHLLGVASEKVERTCLVQIGNRGRQGDDWETKGGDAPKAKRELAEWVKAYAEWRDGVAPFSPTASADYALSENADHARSVWQGDRDGRGDAYQAREFGAGGPMARAEFGDLANRLMEPIPTPVLGTGSRGAPKKGKA